MHRLARDVYGKGGSSLLKVYPACGVALIMLIVGAAYMKSRREVIVPTDTIIIFKSLDDNRALTLVSTQSHQVRCIGEFVARPDTKGGLLATTWVSFGIDGTAIIEYGSKVILYDLNTKKSNLFGEYGKGRLSEAVWARPLLHSPGYIYTDASHRLWICVPGHIPRAIVFDCYSAADCPDASHIVTLQRNDDLQEFDINTGNSKVLYRFPPTGQVSYTIRNGNVAVLLNDRIIIIRGNTRRQVPVPNPNRQIGGIAWASDNVVIYTQLQSEWTDFIALDVRSNTSKLMFRASGAITTIYSTRLSDDHFRSFPKSTVSVY